VIRAEGDNGESGSIAFFIVSLGLVVQAVDDAAGELLLGSEIIEIKLRAEQGLATFFIGRLRERMDCWAQSQGICGPGR